MPASHPITETIILHKKEAVNLNNVEFGTGADTNPAVQAFVQLIDTVKVQQGFLCQFWGRQVENQQVFVWCIDWESLDDATAFVNSRDHASFMACKGRIFDLEAAAPLTMYTRFTSDAHAALSAPVTEVAFFTVPNGAREAARAEIENDSISSAHPVITVGRSLGGAIGWVFDWKNAGAAAADGESLALHGVFGYACVDDHVKWRETLEHAQVVEEMGRSALAELGLGDARVPGGNIFVPDSSMFHVEFRAGM